MKNKAEDHENMEEKVTVYEQSEVPCHYPPAQNEYERSKWNSNGFDQSGMK